jgi:hypothetical protein
MSRYDDSDLERPRRRRRPPRRSGPNFALIAAIFGIGLLLIVGIGVCVWLVKYGLPGRPGPLLGGSTASDLQKLAGSWECTFRDPAGNVTMHKVKEIVGNTETATWYRADGTVFRANRVQFELGTRGLEKVFRYSNGIVLVGPDAGQPFPSGEYVYTLEGNTWTEFEPTGGTIVWTRKK